MKQERTTNSELRIRVSPEKMCAMAWHATSDLKIRRLGSGAFGRNRGRH
jgi:hypothetical protein